MISGLFDWYIVSDDLSLLGNITYIVTVLIITILIILENRSPLKTISWIMVISLLPVIGIVLYVFFGQKYQKRIKYTIKEARYRKKVEKLSKTQIRELSSLNTSKLNPKLVQKKDMMTLLLRNDRAFISFNRTVRILKNGSETFPELKAAIKAAQKSIHLEFYIFKFDNIGNEIFEILKERAAAGVEVRIIYDSMGSYRIPKSKKREVRKSGIQLGSFQRIYFPVLSSRANYRNHRKIVVIDGKVGFTGGLNIADRYVDNQSLKHYWRDTFVKIEGDAVSSLQQIFINDWFYVSKKSIMNDKYFTKDDCTDGKLTQIISSGPDYDWHAISQFYFSAITTSRNYIYIATPYFIPNEELSFAIKAAALRGVDIRILIPKKSDGVITHYACHSYIKEMLKAGVKIYQYAKGFCHSKTLVCDDIMSAIGSANLDYRSLETNFEVCAIVYDEEVANTIKNQYFEDIKGLSPISLKLWNKRAWYKKMTASIIRMLAPLI